MTRGRRARAAGGMSVATQGLWFPEAPFRERRAWALACSSTSEATPPPSSGLHLPSGQHSPNWHQALCRPQPCLQTPVVSGDRSALSEASLPAWEHGTVRSVQQHPVPLWAGHCAGAGTG